MHRLIRTRESATGGLIGALLQSHFYPVDTIIAYSNDAKENLLGVPSSVLAAGAVSEVVAKLMLPTCGEAISVTGHAGLSARNPDAFGKDQTGKDEKISFVGAATSRGSQLESNIERVIIDEEDKMNGESRRFGQKFLANKAIQNYARLSNSQNLMSVEPRSFNMISREAHLALYEMKRICEDSYHFAVHEEGRLCVVQQAIVSIPYASGFYKGGRLISPRLAATGMAPEEIEAYAVDAAVRIRADFSATIGLSVLYEHGLIAVCYTSRGTKDTVTKTMNTYSRKASTMQYMAISAARDVARDLAEPLHPLNISSLVGSPAIYLGRLR
ncbi:MAG: CinA family protein [Nanoarchaeota archaeon]|nr:CinA family protein [Nanoarchaeota archaeon]